MLIAFKKRQCTVVCFFYH